MEAVQTATAHVRILVCAALLPTFCKHMILLYAQAEEFLRENPEFKAVHSKASIASQLTARAS
jgi:hypothetical protein